MSGFLAIDLPTYIYIYVCSSQCRTRTEVSSRKSGECSSKASQKQTRSSIWKHCALMEKLAPCLEKFGFPYIFDRSVILYIYAVRSVALPRSSQENHFLYTPSPDATQGEIEQGILDFVCPSTRGTMKRAQDSAGKDCIQCTFKVDASMTSKTFSKLPDGLKWLCQMDSKHGKASNHVPRLHSGMLAM